MGEMIMIMIMTLSMSMCMVMMHIMIIKMTFDDEYLDHCDDEYGELLQQYHYHQYYHHLC